MNPKRNVDVSGLTALDTAAAHIIRRTMSSWISATFTELTGLDAAIRFNDCQKRTISRTKLCIKSLILSAIAWGALCHADRTKVEFLYIIVCLLIFRLESLLPIKKRLLASSIPGGVQRSAADGNIHAFFGKYTTDKSCARKRQAGENALA